MSGVDQMLAAIVRQAARDVLTEVLAEERPRLVEAVTVALRTAAPDAGAYLSVAEAARVASVKPATIRAWVRQGRLARHMAGRYLRISGQQLQALLAGDAPAPAPKRGRDRVTEILRVV